MSDYSPPTDLAEALVEIRKLRNTVVTFFLFIYSYASLVEIY